MRQNRATSAPFFYCVSYEILCETRIKPSFFGNCLIFPSSAGGPVPGLSIRANGSSLPLVLIERIAHVRGGGGLALSALPWRAPPPKGEARLGSPFGTATSRWDVAQRPTEAAAETLAPLGD